MEMKNSRTNGLDEPSDDKIGHGTFSLIPCPWRWAWIAVQMGIWNGHISRQDTLLDDILAADRTSRPQPCEGVRTHGSTEPSQG